ncbi:MAG: hypothetical protein R2809_03525 [Flavobacteriales bacterium]
MQSKADWGIWQGYVIFNTASTDVYYSTGQDGDDPTATLNQRSFGRFNSSQSFILNGFEAKTYKNGSSNVCNAQLYYRIYRTCDTPGSFTAMSGGFICGFPCTGLNSSGDQKWGTTSSQNINVLAGLTEPGSYVIEMYWQAEGNQNNSSGCGEFAYSSNGGLNFLAYFEYDNNDSFSDGDFSATPTWSGDTGNFTVVNNSDISGLTGSENQRTHTLRLNVAAVDSVNSISTQITTWQSQQDWYFWMGRRANASETNRTRIWLYSDNANLKATTGINGYYIQLGAVGADPISFHRVVNGTASTIFTSASTVYDGAVDYGIAFHISRNESGVWTIRTSALPQNATETQSTPNALSCIGDVATVTQGSFTEATVTPASNGYFGVWAKNSSSFNQHLEFDNFTLKTLPANTYVNFNATSNSVNETDASFVINIPVNIVNVSSTTGTSVQVAVTSGDTGRLVSYAPQTVTWSASETGTKNAQFTVFGNDNCDDLANLVFTLQNVTGGQSAYINTPSSYTLTINDDDMGYATLLSDDFEDGNANGWTSTNSVGTGSFVASSSAPISGTYSLRKSSTGLPGHSQVFTDLKQSSLAGAFTTWRFNFKNFNRNISSGNYFNVAIASSATTVQGPFDGYAVGPDYNNNDYLTLFSVSGGAYTAILTSTVPVTTTTLVMGIQVTRDELGEWELFIDNNGGFDNLVSVGTVTNTTHDAMNYFGADFVFTGSSSDQFSLDDIAVTQKGCRSEYFSQSPGGNLSAAIWAPTTVGTPQTVVPGRFTRLTVQSGAPVVADVNANVGDLAVDTGASLDLGSATVRVYGNLVADGSTTPGTSTVILKGNVAQTIIGGGVASLNNLIVSNDFGSAVLSGDVETYGVITIQNGTLQTGGNLTLKSNAAGSSSIGVISSTGDISGDVTVERFIPSGPAGYFYIGAPTVATTHTIDNVWNDDMVTTGVVGSDYPSYNFNNIYYYDETVPGDRNQGWVGMSSISDIINPTKGYAIYQSSPSLTVDVTGTIQKGNTTIPLSYTNNSSTGDGWNLLVNPYPSEVNWVSVEANSSDVNNYYYYDGGIGGYRAYSANGGVGSGSPYIPHSQAFFVRATGTSQALNFQESHKTNTNQAFERSTEDAMFVRFVLDMNGQGDEAVLAFNENATASYEAEFDAEKLNSPIATNAEFAFVSADGIYQTIDIRELPTELLQVPLFLDIPQVGEFTISFPELQNIPVGSCLSMEDTHTGIIYSIEEGTSLTFTNDEADYTGNRMVVRVTPSAEVIVSNSDCYGLPNGEISITTPVGDWSWSLTNELGAEVSTSSNGGALVFVPAGVYELEMNSLNGECSSSMSDIVITEPANPIVTEFTNSITTCDLGTAVFEAIVVNAGEFSWSLLDENENEITSGTTTDTQVILDELNAGMYTFRAFTSCSIEEHAFVTFDENAIHGGIIDYQPSLVLSENGSAELNVTTSLSGNPTVEWKVNGMVAGIGANFQYVFNEAGNYQVEMIATNASCSLSETVTVAVEGAVSVEDALLDEMQLIVRNGGFDVMFGKVVAPVDIVVTAMNGQQIFKKSNVTANEFVDMSGWAVGAYQVTISNGNVEVLNRTIVR